MHINRRRIYFSAIKVDRKVISSVADYNHICYIYFLVYEVSVLEIKNPFITTGMEGTSRYFTSIIDKYC